MRGKGKTLMQEPSGRVTLALAAWAILMAAALVAEVLRLWR